MDARESSEPIEELQRRLVETAGSVPLAFCSAAGELACATPTALGLLRRLHVLQTTSSMMLPATLWSRLEHAAEGEAIEWHPPGASRSLLGCTRYRTRGGFVLLMRELSGKRTELLRWVSRQRMEAAGRLTASVAHHVRGCVTSILYGADFLHGSAITAEEEGFRETVREIGDASRRLQLTVDGLLDHARLGPSIAVPVSLREVLQRTQGILRTYHRVGARKLNVEIAPDREWVRGNPIVIEQIFLGLLLCARARQVTVQSAEAPRESRASDATQVYLRVLTDAPTDSQLGELLLETAPSALLDASAHDLLAAREAVESQGGALILEETSVGTCIGLSLPRSEGPR